jgi:predicted dithiol-disulfide oxidoreductase (DUF899 family)
MEQHPVVSSDEWVEARKALLVKEKEFSRAREALAAQRRRLPWERVEQAYTFEGRGGTQSLAELFDGMSQLAVYHFMFDPSDEAGCPHCSFWADHFDGSLMHLRARDVAFAAVSRAPFEKIAAYQRRMGWSFPWLSSAGSDFNYRFRVAFTPEQLDSQAAVYNYGTVPGFADREGISIFAKDPNGELFHTYSTYARGIDMVNGAYQWLDLVPKGRDEPGDPQLWVRRHDEYEF